jgi:hypothetical protein
MLALGSSKVDEALLDEIHKEEKEKKQRQMLQSFLQL